MLIVEIELNKSINVCNVFTQIFENISQANTLMFKPSDADPVTNVSISVIIKLLLLQE